MDAKLAELEKVINYSFKNKAYIRQALTHPSCMNEENNERLEFLGDAALNLIIAELLYYKYKNVREDKLSSMRARLVSCDAICIVAENILLKNRIILSPGEEKNGGRNNPRNIENALEALIGAIYLDSGIEQTKIFIQSLWKNLIEDQKILGIDSKTTLQEWAQGNKHDIPKYKLVSNIGPSHAPEFEISVEIEGVGLTTAKGATKKEAEKLAAKKFIDEYLNNEE